MNGLLKISKNTSRYCYNVAKLNSQLFSTSTVSHGLKNVITSHDIQLYEYKIHYESAGYGTKGLLCMPGAIGTGLSDFEHQLKGLDGEKYTIIAWDPPGYGQSRPPNKRFHVNFYRDDAELASILMKNLGYEKYSVLGWSDGGITAMILAANEGREAVEKLVVWGSNAFVDEEDTKRLLVVRDVKKSWSPAFLARFQAIYGEEGLDRLWTELVENYTKMKDICTQDLAKIKAPTFILHGDLDPMVSPVHPGYLLDNIQNATLFRFEKGRHNIHMKYAEEFNKLVQKFLDK